MSFHPVPKPPKSVPRPRKPLRRSAWLPRGKKPIPRVNAQRQARRLAHYRAVIASPFHKQLRYLAWERSGGFCECDECVRQRTTVGSAPAAEWRAFDRAVTRIPVWFVNSGREVELRFRCTAAECHHTSYRYFGDENPDELRLVRFAWKECHRRIEAEHHTRRRYLTGATR